MAALPQSNPALPGLQVHAQPSRTWRIHRQSRRIQGEVSGLEATAQAVEILLHVERFRYQIYRPSAGMQWEGLLGQDSGYVAAELQRRIREALSVDDRVQGISDFTYSISQNVLTAAFTVNTVFGPTQSSVEVTLN